MSYREVDAAFQKYSNFCFSASEDDIHFAVLQQFIVLMYHAGNSTKTVNKARRILLTKYTRAIENIPSITNVLMYHLKRAILQCDVWVNIAWLAASHNGIHVYEIGRNARPSTNLTDT